jgi:hypothetical protein
MLYRLKKSSQNTGTRPEWHVCVLANDKAPEAECNKPQGR